MSRGRSPARFVAPAMAAIAVAGWAVAAVAIARRPRATVAPSPITSRITYVENSRRELSTAAGPVVLHRMSYRSGGGAVTIRWFDSDFESLSRLKVGIVSLYIDGARVTSTIKSSVTGVYEDGQGDLAWRGDLTRGVHQLSIQFDSDADWGMPYTDPGWTGVDELIIDRARNDAG